MKKLDWSELRNSKVFHNRDASNPPHANLPKKKRKKYKNVIKRKHQNKSYKYEKPKPNKHTEKGFYKNTLI